MLNVFSSKRFDNDIVLKNNSKKVCKKDLEQCVKTNIPILKTKKQNVVILTNDILTFTINFLAAVFTNKTIYLTDDINKLKSLNIEFDIIKTYETNFDKDSDIELSEINTDEIFINLLTSGSSGAPKCITKSLSNLIKEAQDINETFKINPMNLLISCSTDFSHLFGLTFGFMFPLCNNHIINLNRIEYPDKIEGENTFLVSTPSFLDTFKKNNIIPNNIKYIASAGSKLNEKTFEYIENFANIIEIYGSTETGVIAYKTHYADKTLTPFKGVKITPFENSTLVVTPYAYEKEIEINDKIKIQGDKITLLERTDRLLKIQEKRISAELIEKVLNKNEFVLENYCFKIQDKIGCYCALTENGKKFLLNNGTVELIKKLKAFLKTKFEIIPQKWKFTDELPKTISGKIDKKQIEHLFEINLSFPIILDRTIEENVIKYKLYFYKNCNFYNGHFPDFPITPGVVQLYIASFFGEQVFQKKLVDGQIRKIKFSNIIKSGDIVYLKLTANEKNVTFEYSDDSSIFSSGSFSCINIFEGDKNEHI